jgi:tetratricopeptide (TPR) repeat protein
MELLMTVAIISYIIYLRYYADLRTKSDKELDQLQIGVKLYNTGQVDSAFHYFDQTIQEHPQWSVAYLYRARCQIKRGNTEAALADLKTGESFDNTVADIHTEIGRILYDRQDFDTAFAEFDKAVFHSQGRDSMAYYWRGRTRQKLNQVQEAQHDLDQALALDEQSKNGLPPASTPTVFFDKRLLTNIAFVLINSIVLLIIIKKSPVIHWPYIMAASSAAAIGFAEPRKGWILAIIQSASLWIAFTFFTDHPTNNELRGLEAFNLYGSIGLTFVGSFIGGILKRAMKPR